MLEHLDETRLPVRTERPPGERPTPVVGPDALDAIAALCRGRSPSR